MNWIRCTKQLRCPICQKPDWCSVSRDGTLAYCMRVESTRPCKSGGWFHKVGEPIQYRVLAKKLRSEAESVPNFAKAAAGYVEALTSCEPLAKRLGVSVRSLERLDVGWNGRGYTFPMRDGRERIVGIRIRGTRGKWCVKGSQNGLFWPEGVYAGSDYPLMICEGESDCAALLTVGFDAIGRPSCTGGVGHVIEFLKHKRREVIVIADQDAPGQDGANRLATALVPYVRSLKVVKPPFHKDVRDWLNAGATRETVLAVIQNVRYVA